jgi:GNAT superfamily N-acetyltransferase
MRPRHAVETVQPCSTPSNVAEDMSTPDFLCRLATQADREVVESFDRASSEEGRLFRGVEVLDESLGSFANRWPTGSMSGAMPFFVVVEQGEIVGFAILDRAAEPRPLLTRIYVTPRARELGAGAALLNYVTAHAEREGAHSIDALSLPGDRETKNLYERQGMKARLIIASRST